MTLSSNHSSSCLANLAAELAKASNRKKQCLKLLARKYIPRSATNCFIKGQILQAGIALDMEKDKKKYIKIFKQLLNDFGSGYSSQMYVLLAQAYMRIEGISPFFRLALHLISFSDSLVAYCDFSLAITVRTGACDYKLRRSN